MQSGLRSRVYQYEMQQGPLCYICYTSDKRILLVVKRCHSGCPLVLGIILAESQQGTNGEWHELSADKAHWNMCYGLSHSPTNGPSKNRRYFNFDAENINWHKKMD